jgi:rubrerythrin
MFADVRRWAYRRTNRLSKQPAARPRLELLMPVRAAEVDSRLLAIYLNDHLAGATAGVALARRAARSAHASRDARETLHWIAEQVAEDRSALRKIMRRLDAPERSYKVRLGWIAERAGRLKMNGRLVRRSPLSSLLELEALRVAIEGKKAGWRALREILDNDSCLDAKLQKLLARAARQADAVEELHTQATSVLAPT